MLHIFLSVMVMLLVVKMTEGFYESLFPGRPVISVGYHPSRWKGRSISEATFVVPCMSEVGIDVSGKYAKQLTSDMVDSAGSIIVFNNRRDAWPMFLRDSAKVRVVSVPDPAFGNLSIYRVVRDRIRDVVSHFYT